MWTRERKKGPPTVMSGAQVWVCKPRMKVDISAVVRRINAMHCAPHIYMPSYTYVYVRVRTFSNARVLVNTFDLLENAGQVEPYVFRTIPKASFCAALAFCCCTFHYRLLVVLPGSIFFSLPFCAGIYSPVSSPSTLVVRVEGRYMFSCG